MNDTVHLDGNCERCGSAGSIEFGMCQVCLEPVSMRPLAYLVVSKPAVTLPAPSLVNAG